MDGCQTAGRRVRWLDADALAAVVAHVDAARWEAYAITARPAGPGRSVQQQTQRWLHGLYFHTNSGR